MQKLTKSFQFGEHTVTLETGEVARQANTVLVSMADTVVMVAVVGLKEAKPGQSFFPLTVNYQEKFYAGGKIPGSFFRRERGATERETLICRLIDRPIRPLFPKGYHNDVQINNMLLSADGENDSDTLSIVAASAALTLSDIPFQGPIAGVRVGMAGDELILIDEALTYEATIYDRESGQIRRKVNVGQYVVERGQRFIAIKPFASRFEWEIHILPLRHEADFLKASREDLEDFARVLRRTMARLDKVVGGVQYNFFLHSQPHGETCADCPPSYHWHLEICPRTSIPTGFELGSGLFVSTISPEDAATQLRAVELD